MKFWIIIFFVFIKFAIATHEQFTSSQGQYGGVLKIDLAFSPKTFNPILATETATLDVTNMMFIGLARLDPMTFDPKPLIAASWKLSKNELNWVINLRNDIFWTDGKKLTADDVVFTYNDIILNPNISNIYQDYFIIEGIKIKVEKLDEYTIKFVLPFKLASFLSFLTVPIMPKHVVINKINQFKSIYSLLTKPEKIISNGPFKLKEYKESLITLEKNPLYFKKNIYEDKLPYLDIVKVNIVKNEEIALLKFQADELDVYGLRSGRIRGHDYKLLKKLMGNNNYTVFNQGSDIGSQFLVFNQNTKKILKTNKPSVDHVKSAWFSNVKFRKAISFAINRKYIIEKLLDGQGYEQYSPMTPSSGYYYTDNVIKYKFDPPKSIKLLKEAGFKYSKNGKALYDNKDNRVEFDLYTNSDSIIRIKICGIIRKNLESIGIRVNFTALTFQELVTRLSQGYDWDSIYIGLTGEVDPYLLKYIWISKSSMHMWNPSQDKPETDWEKEVDKIFDSGARELDKKKRKELFDRWQFIVSDKLPLIFTVLPSYISVAKNHVKNFYPLPHPKSNALYNIEEIYIK
jgi:peptide/nickel transport system substrate-binding protein